MSASSKTEARLLSHEDHELVARTHHPAIYANTRKELDELRQRLRALRDRERTLLHQKAREVRGKAEARGGSFPGVAEHPAQRKQVFAQALKRVNSEHSRLRKMEARGALTAAAQQALALRKSGDPSTRPRNEPTPRTSARSKPSTRSKPTVPGAKVGSVSQANKRAQAAKDKRTKPAS